MTYKQRTIEACKKQAERYRNIKRSSNLDIFFDGGYCIFCQIYLNSRNAYCQGCFMADKSGDVGCTQFKTFRKACRALGDYTHGETKKLWKEVMSTFECRAKFFDKMAIELEKYPAWQFTPGRWGYFDIDRGL